MNIETMKQWLRALEDYKKHTAGVMIPHTRVQGDNAITSLRQAIAEAEKQEQSTEHVGEPVGEMQLSAIYEGMVVPVVPVELPAGTKLYTTPQQRKPLNKKQRIAIIESLEFENSQQELIDAVEAAHGIKE